MAGREARSVERVASPGGVVLRDVTEADFSIFFEQQLDPDANRMAAFTPKGREAFMAHWARILSDETITKQTVLFDGQVAGNVVCFELFGEAAVGYWLGKEYWGKGVATSALLQFLGQVPARPLSARVARDNIASLRVLEKCGFAIAGYDKTFDNALGEVVEEVILRRLEANG
jgi:RimJ/RimL family protein N-acetyltransferase